MQPNPYGYITEYVAITASDSGSGVANGVPPSRTVALRVEGAGNIAIVQGSGDTVTLAATAGETILITDPQRINSTSTTATGIFAMVAA